MKRSAATTTPRRVRAHLLLTLTILLPAGLNNACVKRAFDVHSVRSATLNLEEPQAPNNQQARRININTASADELEKLPGIGRTLAGRIIEHREKFGAFRKAEHLIIVRGLSDKRFRALQDLITVE